MSLEKLELFQSGIDMLAPSTTIRSWTGSAPMQLERTGGWTSFSVNKLLIFVWKHSIAHSHDSTRENSQNRADLKLQCTISVAWFCLVCHAGYITYRLTVTLTLLPHHCFTVRRKKWRRVRNGRFGLALGWQVRQNMIQNVAYYNTNWIWSKQLIWHSNTLERSFDCSTVGHKTNKWASILL